MCGPLTCKKGFSFLRQKKNRLIAGYVASGRLSLWLEDRNNILMPSSSPRYLHNLSYTVGVLTRWGGGGGAE